MPCAQFLTLKNECMTSSIESYETNNLVRPVGTRADRGFEPSKASSSIVYIGLKDLTDVKFLPTIRRRAYISIGCVNFRKQS